jgi:hypothetical protein
MCLTGLLAAVREPQARSYLTASQPVRFARAAWRGVGPPCARPCLGPGGYLALSIAAPPLRVLVTRL